MALQLTYETPSGVSGNYWMVRDIERIPAITYAKVIVVLFKDVAARQAGKDPLLSIGYVMEGALYLTYFAVAVLNLVNVNDVERSYVYLKTLTTPVDFTQAIDV